MAKVRLGHVHYIHCLPLTYGLMWGGMAQGLLVHTDNPGALNELIVNDELDISPVSSIIYAKYADELLLLPQLSVSADGNVRSLLLVSKKPIEELDCSRIAITDTAAVSLELLQIILQYGYGLRPEYHLASFESRPLADENTDGMMLAGDDALYAYYNQAARYYYYDLGAEWKKITELPMVYSIWTVKRKFAANNPREMQAVYEQLVAGLRFGMTHFEESVAAMGDKPPFTSQQIGDYLRRIDYSLSEKHEDSLTEYFRLSCELGLIDQIPALEYAGVK